MRARNAVLFGGAVFLAFYAVGIALRPGHTFLLLQSNLLYNLPGLLVLVLVLKRTGDGQRAERWGWRLMAGMLAGWQLGDWVYSYHALTATEVPLPSLADAFYTAGYAALLLALPLLTYPRQLLRNPRWCFDVLIITIMAGAFQWQLVMAPILEDRSLDPLQTAVALSYPVWDIGLLAIIVGSMFAWRGRMSQRSASLLLAVAVLALTDSLYSYETILGGYDNFGNPLELGWLASYLLIGLAATMPAQRETSGGRVRLPFLWLVLPYALASPLVLLHGYRTVLHEHTDVLALGAAAVLLLAFASHVHASYVTARALEAERRRSRLDGLTGALNHGAIVEDAQALVDSGPGRFWLCLVDADNLKHINDRYGHSTGDRALRGIANGLMTCGAVGRYGGDEFLVLIDAGTAPAARTPEAALQKVLGSTFVDAQEGRVLAVHGSYGVACYPDDAGSVRELIDIADQRMYEEKRRRNAPAPGYSVGAALRGARRPASAVAALAAGAERKPSR